MFDSLFKKFIKPKNQNNNQFVCKCLKVREQDLINAIKNGAKSFEEVQVVTKVGTGCGKCIDANKALVAKLLQNK